MNIKKFVPTALLLLKFKLSTHIDYYIKEVSEDHFDIVIVSEL